MIKKMKYVSGALLCAVILSSCGENSPMKKFKEAKDNINAVSDLVSAGSGVMKDMQDLAELEPLSAKAFEDWVPGETFQGLKRTKMTVGGVSSIAPSVRLFYKDENQPTHYLEIDVVDGADHPMGAMLIAQANAFLSSNIDQEKSGVITRVVDKNGRRAMETIGTESDINTIETIHDGRFYVKVAGREVDIDELWDALEDLKLSKLGK